MPVVFYSEHMQLLATTQAPMNGTLSLFQTSDSSQTLSGDERLLQPLLQFTDGWFLLDLFLGYFFAILLAAILTWSTNRLSGERVQRVVESDAMLLLLGVIGVTVAELVTILPAMALVIFGIGGLIRFRTTFGDTSLTGKGIIIVIIGLACGLGQIAMACFVTFVAWLILTMLESRAVCRIRVESDQLDHIDEDAVRNALLAVTREAKIRIRSIETLPVSGRLEIYLTVPARMTSSAVRSLITSSLDQVVDSAQVQVKFR